MTGRRAPAPTTPTPGRIAVVTASALDVHPACRAAAERAAGALEAAGHRVTEATWDPLPVAHAYQVVRPASVSTMPGEPDEYGPAAGRLIAQGRALTAREYLEAHTAGLTAARLVTRLLDDHDAVLTPTLGLLPMPIADVPPFLEDAWTSYTQFVLPVSFAGTPAVSVPAGEHDGLPIGVQLVGAYREEWALLDLAEQLERADGFGFRRPPPPPPPGKTWSSPAAASSWPRRASSSTTVGSASVVVSPSARFSATSRSRRRMILPDRVFGRSGVKTMFAGAANLPIFTPTWSRSSLSISGEPGSPPFSVT
jgi:hypothetical protein